MLLGNSLGWYSPLTINHYSRQQQWDIKKNSKVNQMGLQDFGVIKDKGARAQAVFLSILPVSVLIVKEQADPASQYVAPKLVLPAEF